jgi:hypothetical protein
LVTPKKPVKLVEMIFGQSASEKHAAMHPVMNISSLEIQPPQKVMIYFQSTIFSSDSSGREGTPPSDDTRSWQKDGETTFF